MMKTMKLFAMIGVAVWAAVAVADANNKLIGFSTVGPDTYASGASVKDGEYYALVWSADGAFGGFNSDCSPAREGDRVIFVAPLAANGHCPYTIFQIDSKSADFKSGGCYAVYLLDTRDAEGNVAAPTQMSAKAATPARPSGINGAVEIANGTTGESTLSAVQSMSWRESVIKGYTRPRVVDFKPIANGRVEFEIEGMMPGVKYNINMGKTVKKLETLALETPLSVTEADGPVRANINAQDARFFSVQRQKIEALK